MPSQQFKDCTCKFTISSAGIEIGHHFNYPLTKICVDYISSINVPPSLYGTYYLCPDDYIPPSTVEIAKAEGIKVICFCRFKEELLRKWTVLMPTRHIIQERGEFYRLAAKDQPFKSKKDLMIWYGAWMGAGTLQENLRYRFMTIAKPIIDEMGFANEFAFGEVLHGATGEPIPVAPAHINPFIPRNLIRPYVLAEKQMTNKYIVVLDGNAFPSALAWNSAINSLMLKNKSVCETVHDYYFFPDIDYIEFSTDFSDLREKLVFIRDNQKVVGEIAEASTEKFFRQIVQNIDNIMLESLAQAKET